MTERVSRIKSKKASKRKKNDRRNGVGRGSYIQSQGRKEVDRNRGSLSCGLSCKDHKTSKDSSLRMLQTLWVPEA